MYKENEEDEILEKDGKLEEEKRSSEEEAMDELMREELGDDEKNGVVERLAEVVSQKIEEKGEELQDEVGYLAYKHPSTTYVITGEKPVAKPEYEERLKKEEAEKSKQNTAKQESVTAEKTEPIAKTTKKKTTTMEQVQPKKVIVLPKLRVPEAPSLKPAISNQIKRIKQVGFSQGRGEGSHLLKTSGMVNPFRIKPKKSTWSELFGTGKPFNPLGATQKKNVWTSPLKIGKSDVFGATKKGRIKFNLLGTGKSLDVFGATKKKEGTQAFNPFGTGKLVNLSETNRKKKRGISIL